MTFELTEATLSLFIFFLLPGFISIQVYGWIIPTRDRSPSDRLSEIASTGAISFLILFLLFGSPLSDKGDLDLSLGMVFAIVFIPAMLPVLLIYFRKLLSWLGMARQIENSVWDFFFLKRSPCFVRGQFKDGSKFGGYVGDKSYITLSPNVQEIYVEQRWELDDNDGFERPLIGTKGFFINRNDCEFMEFFESKDSTGGEDDTT